MNSQDFEVFYKMATKHSAFKDALKTHLQNYLKQMYDNYQVDELKDFTLEDLSTSAASLWQASNQNPENAFTLRYLSQKTRQKSPLPWDILEIVQKDRPFLIDSIMGAIAAQGLRALALFHPVIQADRDAKGFLLTQKSQASDRTHSIRESLIQIHFLPLGKNEQKKLIEALKEVIKDVQYAVDDFLLMRQTMDQSILDLEQATLKAEGEEVRECIDFLRWLRDDHFAFFGVRSYTFPRKKNGHYDYTSPESVEGSGQGILRDDEIKVLRRRSSSKKIQVELETFLNEPTPIIIAKSNLPSRIHRRVYMDYLGVKHYNARSEVIGETRFVGLFTAEAYEQMARNVPLIRRKVKRVLRRAGQVPGTHNEKALQHIVETYPRDELFQIEEDDLLRISLGILHLSDRPRPKLFIRRDRFDRFVSILVYIPRERYDAELRQVVGEMLKEAYGGRLSAFYPKYGDTALARVHFIIGLNPFDHPEPDVDVLEEKLGILCHTWEDKLAELAEKDGRSALQKTVSTYAHAFPAGYREVFETGEALVDLVKITDLGTFPEIAVNAYQKATDNTKSFHFKLYRRGEKVSLSKIMPIFRNMGLLVIQEAGYALFPNHESGEFAQMLESRRQTEIDNAQDMSQSSEDSTDSRSVRGEAEAIVETGAIPEKNAQNRNRVVWIHDFEMQFSTEINFKKAKRVFEEAILSVWTERNENDGFNALILGLGISWREAAFLRTCAKYRQQTGYDASQLVQEQAMIDNPEIVRLLLALKTVKFDPACLKNHQEREEEAKELEIKIKAALNKVASLDADRVLRRIGRLLVAVVRTSFYQTDSQGAPKPYIAIKIESRQLIDIPEPKPYREIYVSAANVEGVHIRFGAIARGGLRWSDRRDDFRTEVLGLVKAQQVKNAVIVPVGSKGGFFPKNLPKGGTREAIRAEAIRAYKTFISGLLDITDTLDGNKVIPPKNVLRWDGDDPYLVVAADKGTATFSDIANGLAREHGFWLDDAFASGGSTGYDHKEMGITARGAWEAVKRHFRELGKDIQRESFRVIGIGDMSGDVFGNGMLLSKKIRLLAAFDHRNIFIDPNPDEAVSWKERQRLFLLPRSSWEAYNARLISKGGGVFSRAAKSIKLSAEIKEMTGLSVASVTPGQLIAALLRSPCELLWFGGIGTYIKTGQEQNWEVGDKANDDIRADAAEIKAKVIGEGANLGVTQAGRISFARLGGKINTDAIDNSAGVDSSDHEVNLKILFNTVMRSEKISMEARNKLLESMTDHVASHVLRHNYNQTRAISVAESCAKDDIDAHARLMLRLEKDGVLNRELEGLPSPEQIRSMKTNEEKLTRPELAVLIAYAKITLFDRIVDSDVPEDPYFEKFLVSYFPKEVGKYQKYMHQHRLKREIIATQLANLMVDMGGATFYHRVQELSGASFAQLTKAFAGSLEILGIEDLVTRVDILDNRVPTGVQIQMLLEIVHVLRHQTVWFSRRLISGKKLESASVHDMINTYGANAREMRPKLMKYLSPFDRRRVEKRVGSYIKEGVPRELAVDIAALKASAIVSNITDLSVFRDWPIEDAALLFFKLGAHFRLDKLRHAVSYMLSPYHWDRVALKKLSDDFYTEQTRITSQVMDFVDQETSTKCIDRDHKKNWAEKAIKLWIEEHHYETKNVSETLDLLETSGEWSPAKLYLALAKMRELTNSGLH